MKKLTLLLTILLSVNILYGVGKPYPLQDNILSLTFDDTYKELTAIWKKIKKIEGGDITITVQPTEHTHQALETLISPFGNINGGDLQSAMNDIDDKKLSRVGEHSDYYRTMTGNLIMQSSTDIKMYGGVFDSWANMTDSLGGTAIKLNHGGNIVQYNATNAVYSTIKTDLANLAIEPAGSILSVDGAINPYSSGYYLGTNALRWNVYASSVNAFETITTNDSILVNNTGDNSNDYIAKIVNSYTGVTYAGSKLLRINNYHPDTETHSQIQFGASTNPGNIANDEINIKFQKQGTGRKDNYLRLDGGSSSNALYSFTMNSELGIGTSTPKMSLDVHRGAIIRSTLTVLGMVTVSSGMYIDYITENGGGTGVVIDRANNYYAGMISTPTITDNGDGTITVGASTCCIYSNTQYMNGYYLKPVASKILTPTNNEVSYVTISWNGGSPEYGITTLTNRGTINQSTVIPVFRLYRKNNVLDYNIDYGPLAKGLPNQEAHRVIRLRGIEKESGLGLSKQLLNGTSRAFQVESGIAWFGVKECVVSQFNSSDTVNYTTELHTRDSSGNWTLTTTTSMINNLWYQTATGTATLTTNRYAVNWIYRNIIPGNNELDIILGNGDYTQSQAEASTIPSSLPNWLNQFYVFCGRIIIQKGSNDPYAVESVQSVAFTQQSVTDHTELTNIGTKTHTQLESDISALYTSTGTIITDNLRNIYEKIIIGDVAGGAVNQYEVICDTYSVVWRN